VRSDALALAFSAAKAGFVAALLVGLAVVSLVPGLPSFGLNFTAIVTAPRWETVRAGMGVLLVDPIMG